MKKGYDVQDSIGRCSFYDNGFDPVMQARPELVKRRQTLYLSQQQAFESSFQAMAAKAYANLVKKGPGKTFLYLLAKGVIRPLYQLAIYYPLKGLDKFGEGLFFVLNALTTALRKFFNPVVASLKIIDKALVRISNRMMSRFQAWLKTIKKYTAFSLPQLSISFDFQGKKNKKSKKMAAKSSKNEEMVIKSRFLRLFFAIVAGIAFVIKAVAYQCVKILQFFKKTIGKILFLFKRAQIKPLLKLLDALLNKALKLTQYLVFKVVSYLFAWLKYTCRTILGDLQQK